MHHHRRTRSSLILQGALVSLLLLSNVVEVQGQTLQAVGFTPKDEGNAFNELELAKDIRAMREAHTNFTLKKSIYTTGGDSNTGSLTLQGLSLNAEDKWGQYPMYRVYTQGYNLLGQEVEGDQQGNFDGKPVAHYADTLVNDLFLLNVTNIEAEAALSMNVAMAFYCTLYDMLTACKQNLVDQAHVALDKAAAFYIGADQVPGDSTTGYFLYNLAQFVGERFNQFSIDGDSQVLANSNVLAALNLIQSHLDGDKCSSPLGISEVRDVVKSLWSNVNQILLQMLIHRAKTYTPGKPTDFVELYSLALLPQVAACQSDLFVSLLKYTVTLNVDSSTEADLFATLQQSYSCFGVTCSQIGAYAENLVPECDEGSLETLAGYEPNEDERVKSRIDRDIRMMRWMMEAKAYDGAQDIYEYGWNSIFTLQQLAKAEAGAFVGSDYVAMATYFANAQDKDFADAIVMQILQGTGPFATATDTQREAYLDAVLRGMIMYIATTNEMEAAINVAVDGSGPIEDAQKLWDSGVGYYIGSTEGDHVGGSKDTPGESLFGLANAVCEHFGTCTSDNVANVNGELLNAFESIKTALQNSDASAAQQTYSSVVRPNLVIPLIQGVLDSIVEAGKDPNGPFIGDAFGYSRVLLAIYDNISPSDVASLEQSVQAGTSVTTANVDNTFVALQNILQNAAVATDCAEIGGTRGVNDESRDICQGTTIVAPEPSAPTPAPNSVAAGTPAPVLITRSPVAEKPVPEISDDGIGWGRYTFTDATVRDNDSAVGEDVKRMWTADSIAEAQDVYTGGGDSVVAGLFGLTATINNLQQISTSAQTTMATDPIFNFYRYAFYEPDLFDDQENRDVWDFANKVVERAFSTGAGGVVLAAESVVVMHSYLMIMRQLNQATQACFTGDSSSLRYLDSAVAIWIGEEQGEGLFNSGYMLYSMSQLAIDHYGFPEIESDENYELMVLFNDAKSILSTCTNTNTEAFKAMRMKVKEINTAFVKVFVQNWLWYASAGDKVFQDLFTAALVPHMNACGAGDYEFLFDNQELFSGDGVGTDIILTTMPQFMACLGLTCDDLGDATNSETPKLQESIDEICDSLPAYSDSDFFAGYQAEDNAIEARQEARFDLDVLQINIFMETNALSTANEWYEHGYNSMFNGTSQSLKNIVAYATAEKGYEDELSGWWSSYFTDANYPDKFITDIFFGQGAYAQASRGQKAAAVASMFQAGVTHLVVAQHLQDAFNDCEAEKNGNPHVDRAAGFMIGSIEGPRSSGNPAKTGTMLYGLANEICEFFDKCETGGDATANEFILFAFDDIKQWLYDNNCDSGISIARESLLPMLAVPVIQGLLVIADASTSAPVQSTLEELAALDVFARALLPQINDANGTSAATIAAATDFNPNQKAVPDGTAPIFDALRFVLNFMKVDCDVIGTLDAVSTQSTCAPQNDDVPLIAPPSDTETKLGDDLYTTTTYVKNLADIALDIKQMEDNLELGRKEPALVIYKDGQNSPIYDKFGIKTDVRAIADFSTNASNTMSNNPIYQVTVFALEDEIGEYLGKDARSYADTVVMSFFESQDDSSTIAAEAAVVLNIGMEVINELYQQLDNCRNLRIRDDDGIHSIDQVAALYIGDGEISGNSNQGHLLYNLAEKMAITFGTVDPSGVATANLKFLRLLTEARLDLSFPQACSGDLSTVRKLTRTVNKMIPQMTVVQVQALIHSLLENDKKRVFVHSHAVVPLIRACNEVTFDYLRSKLLNVTYQETEIDAIITRIYDSLFCFGLTCEDIGTHQEKETGAKCTAPSSLAPMVGYHPRKEVTEYAKVDLDIKYLDILMIKGALGPALDLYQFGLHSSGLAADGTSSISLQSLAIGSGRSVVPEYNTHVQYYGSDNNYADTIITQGLDPSSDFNEIQRREIVVGGAQYMVMYMAVLQAMYESIAACKAGGRQDAAALSWDKAAAYIVGSLEGVVEENYSVRPGVFLWGLGKKYCTEFGTCRNIVTGSSLANEEILSILYTGRGAASVQSCEALEKAAQELTSLIRVALFQTSLSEVAKAGGESDGPLREIHAARGFMAARALLPLISKENRDDANFISSALDFEGPLFGAFGETEKRENALTVQRDLVNNIDDLDVDCSLVGTSNNVDACSGEVTANSRNRVPIVIGILLGAIFGGSLAVILFMFQSRKNEKGPEEQAKFIRNTQGVLDDAQSDFDPSDNRAQVATDELEHSDAAPGDGGVDANGDGSFSDVHLPEPV